MRRFTSCRTVNLIGYNLVRGPYDGRSSRRNIIRVSSGEFKGLGTLKYFLGHNKCQGVTPSNSKVDLPAPEAGARAERGGVRDEIDPSPSRSEGSQDKAGPQAVGLTQPPRESKRRARPGGPPEKEAERGTTPCH